MLVESLEARIYLNEMVHSRPAFLFPIGTVNRRYQKMAHVWFWFLAANSMEGRGNASAERFMSEGQWLWNSWQIDHLQRPGFESSHNLPWGHIIRDSDWAKDQRMFFLSKLRTIISFLQNVLKRFNFPSLLLRIFY